MSKVSVSRTGPELSGMTCVELIGSGGFADVYLYEQAQPRMRVAVKLIKASVVDDQKRRQFAAEADAMAELAEHPYIVPVLGAGTAPDGRPYLVMRYYPSADLASRVAQSPMSVPDVLRYGVQLSSAVETAHRAGIIHRDIKPSNILLSSYGQPGLSDFGIAGRPGDVTDDDADDDIGVSIPWSPPEVLTGASNGSVTSDVYSLAATVWNLLVGRAPFFVPGGDNGERATMTRIVHGRPTHTGRDDVPASLDRLLQQALAKEPAHRPQSALELAHHFQRVEQELKLARTEVVVLAPEPVAEVTAPTPVPPTPAADVPAATTNRPRDVVLPPVVADAGATELKAPRRVGPVQQPTPSQSSEAARPTEYRPRVVSAEPTPIPGPEEPTDRRSGRRRLLLAAAGVVVVAAVGVGAAFAGSGRSNTGDSGSSTPPAPTDTSLGDVMPGGSGPAAPKVLAVWTPRGKSVVFSWVPVSGATSYSWTTDDGRAGRTTGHRLPLDRLATGQTCVTVRAVADGLPASPGARACGG